MGTATVITSGKGGVGKSTISVGIGRALAARGRRVLLIDCDAGLRSLDRMTGVEENLLFDVSDVVFGRCAPIEAIYPCPEDEGLFLLPAPSSSENMIKPSVMKKLVPLLTKYYDHVLLDSPAGVGIGFKAAVCAADRAIVVCSADPVSIRDCTVVKSILDKLGNSDDTRLIINRFNEVLFEKTGMFDDIDAVIDVSGIRLMGVVPEDFSMAAAFLRGTKADTKFSGMMALSRIAGRLEGEDVPVVI